MGDLSRYYRKGTNEVAEGVIIEQENFNGDQLNNLKFNGVAFVNCDFGNTQIDNCNFQNCEFVGCSFATADVKTTIFDQCEFRRIHTGNGCRIMDCQMENCKVIDTIINAVQLLAVNIHDSEVNNGGIRECWFRNCHFIRIQMNNVVRDQGNQMDNCDEVDVVSR